MANVQKDLRLFYNGKDITGSVDILECVVRDVSRRESDCMNLLVDHADKWFQWGVQKNDTLRVTRSGYDTKNLYLNTIVPEEGAFRIYATGSKCTPFPAKWESYEKKTLGAIMAACAGEGNMGSQQNGISGGILYEYLLRENLSAPVFLEQLINREGAVMKSLNGKFCAIGIGYAQGLKCMHTVQVGSKLAEAQYVDRRDQSWSSVTIDTPFGKGTAIDRKSSGKSRVITDIAVDNDAQAKRWAKGILLCHNREGEILTVEMDFNPGYTAMVRVDVDGNTDTKGQWLVDEVEQDLVTGRTKGKLFRCVTSIV